MTSGRLDNHKLGHYWAHLGHIPPKHVLTYMLRKAGDAPGHKTVVSSVLDFLSLALLCIAFKV